MSGLLKTFGLSAPLWTAGRGFVANAAKMHFHIVPDVPVAILHLNDVPAMKAFKLALAGLR
jgi:hypothetical protein